MKKTSSGLIVGGALLGAGLGYAGGSLFPITKSRIEDEKKRIKSSETLRLKRIDRMLDLGRITESQAEDSRNRIRKIHNKDRAGAEKSIRSTYQERGSSLGTAAGVAAGLGISIRRVNRDFARKKQEWQKTWDERRKHSKNRYENSKKKWDEDFRKKWEDFSSKDDRWNQWAGGSGSNRQNQYQRSSGPSYSYSGGSDRIKDKLGLGNLTTKADVKKKFRDLAYKSHPDVGGSNAKMQELNSEKEIILKSEWFRKLAFIYNINGRKKMNENFRDGFEKQAAAKPLLGRAAKYLGKLTGIRQMKAGLAQARKGAAKGEISGPFTSRPHLYGPNSRANKLTLGGAARLGTTAVVGAGGLGAAAYGLSGKVEPLLPKGRRFLI